MIRGNESHITLITGKPKAKLEYDHNTVFLNDTAYSQQQTPLAELYPYKGHAF